MYLEQEIKKYLSKCGFTFKCDFNYCSIVTGEMNVPAYTSPALCLGRTYDIRKLQIGDDIFPSDVPTKTIKKDGFTFRFKNIQNSQDCKEVLNLSGDTSLKVKVGLIEGGGSGKYLNYIKTKEGTTEILAVSRIYTVRLYRP